MATTGTDVLESSVRTADRWLTDVADRLAPGEDQAGAYRALRAVLHALRDRLTADEAAHLSAQLPPLVRGVFYEGWRPAGKPLKEHREAFLRHVEREFGPGDVDAEAICRAVFATVEGHVTSGEVDKILGCLPADLRTLWP